jgi:hypothetical protein
MSARAWWLWGVVGALLAAAIGISLVPSDADDYRTVAVQSADDAMSQVLSVRLLLEGDLSGKTMDPYVDGVLWQAHDTLSTAVSDVAKQEVPDKDAIRVQAEINPLLAAAGRALGAAESAAESTADDASDAKRAAIRKLNDVAEKLSAFSEENR